MSADIYFAAVVILLGFAVFDLSVGVTNDAVNFLNSSIGSRVAPFYVIMIIASVGILSGVTFSGGMMEVARKGIFHPKFFTMPELITIFMAVMLTDVLLLDLFNTHGLPTSTTVSIVFELLGAAVAASVIKIMQSNGGVMTLGEYINTAKAMMIVFGILLSVVVAFFSGAIVQFFTRLLFTFDYRPRLKRYGAVWGGVALSVISYFILVKGAKGASFMTSETVHWIKTNALLILFMIFVVSSVLMQIFISFFRFNILKIIVLAGTFALAMAFAANDLVNFIGVPLAGLAAYKTAMASTDPLNVLMSALGNKAQAQTGLLLLAGGIMVLTLWLSKKARTVSETELSLGKQEEGAERFESIWLSRAIVNMADSIAELLRICIPAKIRTFISHRFDTTKIPVKRRDERTSFDLLRASVNLMVASAVVSFATSLKLPLSTTYVTFMVSMGSSFSDQAWGRESAVYRVTGVLTVIGGWFLTALVAFFVSFLFASIIHHFQVLGVIGIMVFAALMIWSNYIRHKVKVKEKESYAIYVLRGVNDTQLGVSSTFEHVAYLLKEIRESFDITFEALLHEDIDILSKQRKKIKKIQIGANMIMANVFKVLRLLQKEDTPISYKYAQTIRRLQKLSDGHRDIVLRSYVHTSNKHSCLLESQVDEIKEIRDCIQGILLSVENVFKKKEIADYENIVSQFQHMITIADEFNHHQAQRIKNDKSKTRLSILFYAIVGNCLMLGKQNIKLLEIFNESFETKD